MPARAVPTMEPTFAFEDDLIRQQEFLRRLALQLVRDEARADDLVQETFVVALTRPPRERAALGGWMATVLRRLAGREARGERRRLRRERLVAEERETDAQGAERSGVEAGAKVDEQLDVQSGLLELLRELPDGERRALFLRYAEDLAPTEIARRLDVPVDTIKTRLKRGKARLRRRLDGRYGEREAWAVALLAPVPFGTAGGASALAATSAATSGSIGEAAAVGAGATAWAGGMGMATMTKWMAGTLVCALGVWLGRGLIGGQEPVPLIPLDPGAGPALASTPVERAETVSPAAAARDGVVETEVPAPKTADAPVERTQHAWIQDFSSQPTESIESPPWPLVVQVTGGAVQGASVRVKAFTAEFVTAGRKPLQGTLDAAGRASFDVAPLLVDLLTQQSSARPQELSVRVEGRGFVPRELRVPLPDPFELESPPDAPLMATLEVRPGSWVRGRVLDRHGEPVDGAFVEAIALLENGLPVRGKTGGHTRSGSAAKGKDLPAGVFELVVDGEGSHALLVLSKKDRPSTVTFEARRGGELDLGDVELEAGLAVDGRAVGFAGRPQDGLKVFVSPAELKRPIPIRTPYFGWPNELAWIAGRFELPFVEAEVDEEADGRFRVERLGPYPVHVTAHVEGARDKLVKRRPQRVTPPATVLIEPAEALLELELHFARPHDVEGLLLWRLEDRERKTSIGHEGEVLVERFLMEPNSTVELELAIRGHEPQVTRITAPAAGEVFRHVVELEPLGAAASLAFTFTGVELEEGQEYFVVAKQAGRRERKERLRVGSGELLDDLVPGPVSIELTVGTDRFAPKDHLRTVKLDLDLLPGERREERVHLEVGGSLSLEVFDPSGKRVNAGVRLERDGARVPLTLVANCDDGSRIAGENIAFECGASRALPPLEPGRYELTLHPHGFSQQHRSVTIEAGRTTHMRVELER